MWKPRISVLACVLGCFLIVTSGFVLDSGGCFAPAPCTCTWGDLHCEDADVQSIPYFQHHNLSDWRTSTFFFDNNNISGIKDYAFSNLIYGNTSILLSLENNSISTLSDFCFDTIQNNLIELRLTNNRLSSLPMALKNLTKLNTLSIDLNPLITLDPSVMRILGRQLANFAIGLAHFNSWPSELHYCIHLQVLVLNSIPFKSLPADAFNGFENTLYRLDIDNSNLEKLPLALCHLKQLVYFFFENNVNLLRNVIHAEKCQQDTMSSIIVMTNDSLEAFPNILSRGSYYRGIDMSRNNMHSIQETSIPTCNISSLIFDYNYFTRIPSALSRISQLETLALSHNSITIIADLDLANLVDIKSLSLDYNDIQYISLHAFTNNKYLRSIDLTNNKLTAIPGAITLVPALSNLEMNQNVIECTCLEFDPALLNMSLLTINGHCEFDTETLQAFVTSNPGRCQHPH